MTKWEFSKNGTKKMKDCDYCNTTGKCGYESEVRGSYSGDCPFRVMLREKDLKV